MGRFLCGQTKRPWKWTDWHLSWSARSWGPTRSIWGQLERPCVGSVVEDHRCRGEIRRDAPRQAFSTMILPRWVAGCCGVPHVAGRWLLS